MSPIRMGIFSALADANLRLTRNSEQKVGEGISFIEAIEGKSPARVVRKSRVETEMKEIASKLDGMVAAMDQNIVVKFKIAIDPGVEASCSPNRAEDPAQIDLWVAHIRRIRGCAQHAILCSKRVPRVGIPLPSGDTEPAEPKFVEDIRRERVRFAHGQIDGMRPQGPAKTR